MNETAKKYVDIFGVDITVAETIESLSNLISSIAHQIPYGQFQSSRLFDDIANACIHMEMMAYIATNDETQKDVVDIIHKRLDRIDNQLKHIQLCQPSISTE